MQIEAGSGGDWCGDICTDRRAVCNRRLHSDVHIHAPRRSPTSDGELQAISVVQASNFVVGWRGGAMVGRRTCDQEVASSIPGRARLRNDSGQVVHTQLPRR